MNNARRVLMLTAAVWANAAFAGGGLGSPTGGATEVTQLLNHVELASSVSQQATMVGQNATAQLTRISQLANQIKNLVQLPQNLLAQTLAPYQQQIGDLKSVVQAVGSLQSAAAQTQALLSNGISEMNTTGMSPLQWLNAYINLAQQQGGQYKQQLDSDLDTLSNLSQQAQHLQTLSAQIPQVSGNVQGLQLLNQQANLLGGEMVELRGLVQRQVVTQEQDKLSEANAQAASAQEEQQRIQALQSTIDSEKAWTSGVGFSPLNDSQ